MGNYSELGLREAGGSALFFLPLHSFGLYMKAVLTSLLATLEVFAFNPHHVVILGYCARVDLIVNVKSVNESRRREIRRFKLIFSLGLSPTKGQLERPISGPGL
jgi:hypothetical protein